MNRYHQTTRCGIPTEHPGQGQAMRSDRACRLQKTHLDLCLTRTRPPNKQSVSKVDMKADTSLPHQAPPSLHQHMACERSAKTPIQLS